MKYYLNKYKVAQENSFEAVVLQLKAGKKYGDWMWYYFPQLIGLGKSQLSCYYAINSIDEAKAYYNDVLLGNRLVHMSKLLLDINCKDILDVMDFPDNLKLKSSMTLFEIASNDVIFAKVLDKYFNGERDLFTINNLKDKF